MILIELSEEWVQFQCRPANSQNLDMRSRQPPRPEPVVQRSVKRIAWPMLKQHEVHPQANKWAHYSGRVRTGGPIGFLYTYN